MNDRVGNVLQVGDIVNVPCRVTALDIRESDGPNVTLHMVHASAYAERTEIKAHSSQVNKAQ